MYDYKRAPQFNMSGSCKPLIEVFDVLEDKKLCKTEKEAYLYSGHAHKVKKKFT